MLSPHYWLRHQWLLVMTHVDWLLIRSIGIVHVAEQVWGHVLGHVLCHVLGAEVLYEVFVLVRLTPGWSCRSSQGGCQGITWVWCHLLVSRLLNCNLWLWMLLLLELRDHHRLRHHQWLLHHHWLGDYRFLNLSWSGHDVCHRTRSYEDLWRLVVNPAIW